jgi:hypothetical protein
MSKKLKYYFIGVSFISMITCVSIIPLHTSYGDNTVEQKSSVSYETVVDDRRLEEVNQENDINAEIDGNQEVNMNFMNFSTNDYELEEPIAGITKSLSTVENKYVKKLVDTNYMWTTDIVNLRSEASTNSDILTTVDKRSKVEVLKKTSSKWVKVKYEDKEGYIFSKYLRDTELPSLDFTDEEIEILQRITEAECTGQSIESKENVVSVIINRILDLNFPDTVSEIVFQDGQFSPISDKRYYSVSVTEKTIEAVNNVIKNGTTNDGLFFCNINDIKILSYRQWFKNLEFLFKDDSGHSFYK